MFKRKQNNEQDVSLTGTEDTQEHGRTNATTT